LPPPGSARTAARGRREERGRFLREQPARACRAHGAGSPDPAAPKLEQVRHHARHVALPMRCEYPGHGGAGRGGEPVEETRVVARVESVRDLVEQQQPRSARECACDEHQAPLAVREREEPALRERRDAQAA
jgi:hypothetical protein